MLGASNVHEPGHEEEESPAEEADWALTYEELKDRVDNLDKAIKAIEEKIGLTEAEVENKTQELEVANLAIENQAKEISKIKAGKTDVTPNGDPHLIDNSVVDPNAAFFNAMVKSLQRKA